MRLIQMACAVVVLAIFCYFLATLAGYNYRIGFWVKAVTGVSAAGIFYTFVALLFLCCAPGHPFPSILMILLDLGFLAGFLYVAIVNRGGGGSCVGEVKTAFGRGKADSNVLDQDEDDKTSTLPLSLGLACRLQKACLAVSIIATYDFPSAFVSAFLTLWSTASSTSSQPSLALA
jgi:type III secretory pathway component EscV